MLSRIDISNQRLILIGGLPCRCAFGRAPQAIQARQAGGETLDEIVDQPFVEQDLPRTRWQLRMQSSEIRRQTGVVRRQTSDATQPADR